MPRPQLAVGQYGDISVTQEQGHYVALARYRDDDGITRRVKAQGKSKAAAKQALKDKLAARGKTDGAVDGETRVKDLAERYYDAKKTEDLAYNTMRRLRGVIDDHIIPRVGNLRIREATTERLDKFVRDVIVKHGPATALVVRSGLSGMMSAAVRWGGATTNPVEHTTVPKLARQEIKALTLDEFLGMRAHAVEVLRPLTQEERLVRAEGDKRRMGGDNREQTPLDVVDFLIATGARAAEVLGMEWADVHLDEKVPWVRIRQQVIRKTGDGLVLTKTKERDTRILKLPLFAVEMLDRRQAGASGPMVFTSEVGTLIDPRNMRRAWQKTFEGSEWEWVTQKTLRKTVATYINKTLGAKTAADQLGHASEDMTRKHYIAPSLEPLDTGDVMEVFTSRGTETGRFAEGEDLLDEAS